VAVVIERGYRRQHAGEIAHRLLVFDMRQQKMAELVAEHERQFVLAFHTAVGFGVETCRYE